VSYPYGRDRPPDPEAALPVDEWLLDVKTYGIREAVSPWLRETLEAGAFRDVVFDNLILKLQAQILTRDVRSYDVEATQRVPASWWGHYRDDLWWSSAGPGWQRRLERWLWRRLLRADRITWRTLTATLHVQEFVAYPEADPALARTLGGGVPKRIVSLPYWLAPYDTRGDIKDHD
jgi:hypothetical protein